MFEHNYITPKQASVFTGMSEAAIKSAIYNSKNALPAFRAGSRILIKTKDFERWLDEKASMPKTTSFYVDIKKTLADTLLRLVEEHGCWEGSCSELSDVVYETNNGLSLSPSSIGRLLSNMEDELSENKIGVIKKRGCARVHYFFSIT